MLCKVHRLGKRWFFSWNISSWCMRYLRLPTALQGILFSINMYKARIIRYLQQFSSICDSLMPCTVQFCRKRWIFDSIFQVGACPNLKDSLISEYFSLHMYKTYRVRYHLEIFHENSSFSKKMYRTRHKRVADRGKLLKIQIASCLVHMNRKPVI